MNSEKMNSANKTSTEFLRTKISCSEASGLPIRSLYGDRIGSREENTSHKD